MAAGVAAGVSRRRIRVSCGFSIDGGHGRAVPAAAFPSVQCDS